MLILHPSQTLRITDTTPQSLTSDIVLCTHLIASLKKNMKNTQTGGVVHLKYTWVGEEDEEDEGQKTRVTCSIWDTNWRRIIPSWPSHIGGQRE